MLSLNLISIEEIFNVSHFIGVPDSRLQSLCKFIIDKYRISENHIISANEGNAVALAAGYHFATGKNPCVYLQNSGIGNTINPIVSLTSEKVYGVPCVYIIGWRGEPGSKDAPQHMFQGEITLELLDTLNIEYYILGKTTTEEELNKVALAHKEVLDQGKSVAYLIKKDVFEYQSTISYKNKFTLLREEAIRNIINYSKEDIVVATTGKTSRELYEVREHNSQSHKYDFLTVGSMGHCSSIALGIALNKPKTRIWCLDGDGAAIMHMGAMATIGAHSPQNYTHVILNNEAHESVGGQPTVASQIDFCKIAEGCGYKNIYSFKLRYFCHTFGLITG